MWDLKLGRKKKAELTNFECQGYEGCNELRDFLEEEFISKVIYKLGYDGEDLSDRNPIEDYNNPMSARMLMGVLKYFNDFTLRPTETSHINIDADKELIHVFLNCHGESVKDALSQPVPRGYFEASLYQNLLDNLGIPDEIEIDLQKLLTHRLLEEGNPHGPLILLANITRNFTALGQKLDGQISFVKDPVTLSKLDFKNLQRPEIKNVTSNSDSLDQIAIK